MNLTAPVGATLGDAQGQVTIADDDAPSLASRELRTARGSGTTSPAQTGTPGQDAFRVHQAPRASYEVVLDAVSGDAAPPVLERLAADNATVLQSGTPVGTGGGVALRWENTARRTRRQPARARAQRRLHDRLRPRRRLPPDRARDDGLGPALQQRRRAGDGARPAEHDRPRGRRAARTSGARPARCWARTPSRCRRARTAAVNTATVAGAAGQTGSITVAHDAGYGGIAGKAVAVDPATGAVVRHAARQRGPDVETAPPGTEAGRSRQCDRARRRETPRSRTSACPKRWRPSRSASR